MHTQTVDLGAEARLARILADDVFQDSRAVQRTVKLTRAVVCHWPEEGTGGILAVAEARKLLEAHLMTH